MHILCSSRLRRRARARDSVRVPYASHHKHQHPCHHSSQAPGRRPLTGRRSTARRGCCTAVSQPSTALRWTSCAHLGAAADELPLVPADGGRGRGGRGGGGRGREAEGAQDGREAALPPQMLRRGGGGGFAGIFKMGGSEYPRLQGSRVLRRAQKPRVNDLDGFGAGCLKRARPHRALDGFRMGAVRLRRSRMPGRPWLRLLSSFLRLLDAKSVKLIFCYYCGLAAQTAS